MYLKNASKRFKNDRKRLQIYKNNGANIILEGKIVILQFISQ